jgi:hypothetical protein
MKIKSVEQVICLDTTIPATRPVTNKIFELSEPFVYRFKIKSRGKWHDFERHIPKGYLTDKRTSEPLRRRDGLCEFAAIGHDPDYETAGYTRFIDEGLYIMVDGERSTITKGAADDMYRLCAQCVIKGIEPFKDKAWIVMFGWIYWGKTKREIIKIRKEREKSSDNQR